MNSDIIFVADVFVDQVIGGGELNNDELIKILRSQGCTVTEKKSYEITLGFLKSRLKSKFIISNFIFLPLEIKDFIEQKCDYLIYEHDHKYLTTRDPSVFENYQAPKKNIINLNFYKNAKAVLCQSKLHAEVVKKNLGFNNIVSVGGNLWSLDSLNFLREMNKKAKKDRYSIWKSENPIKNTSKTIMFCKHKNYDFDLVGNLPYRDFLNKITDNKNFVFFPETLETLCRVAVECRMAGMSVLTSDKIGAASEDWFSLKGDDLIDKMLEKREEIPSLVLEVLNNE